MTMAKSKKVSAPTYKPPKRSIRPGVGFNPTQCEHGNVEPHYVVLMCSVHGGIEVFGPFLTRTSARQWIDECSEGELFEHFDTAREQGVSFVVKWLDVPMNYERD
jgi:hypothetical protein